MLQRVTVRIHGNVPSQLSQGCFPVMFHQICSQHVELVLRGLTSEALRRQAETLFFFLSYLMQLEAFL